MNRKEVEDKYKSKGLEIEHGKDKPHTMYEPHRHEKTFLYTLGGSLMIKVEDGEWVRLNPGQEFVIGGGKLHEAVVGQNGWEYIVAWNEDEARKYES